MSYIKMLLNIVNETRNELDYLRDDYKRLENNYSDMLRDLNREMKLREEYKNKYKKSKYTNANLLSQIGELEEYIRNLTEERNYHEKKKIEYKEKLFKNELL